VTNSKQLSTMGPFKLFAVVFATTATASTFYDVPHAPANSTSVSEQVSITASISTTFDIVKGPTPVHTPAIVTSFPNASDSGVMSVVSSTPVIVGTSTVVGQCLIPEGCVVVPINETASTTVYPSGPSIPAVLPSTLTANQSTVIVTETFNSTGTYQSATGSATKSAGATTSTIPVSSGGKFKMSAVLVLAALVFGVLGA
jgi:hypothetical protein